MSGVESIVGVILEPALRLKDYLEKQKKDEKIKKELFQGLKTEIISYEEAVDNLSDVTHNKLIPKVNSLSNEYSSIVLNDIILAEAEYFANYSKMILSHIDVAKGCNEISGLDYFMEELKEADIVLCEFVNEMGKTYNPNDTVKITGRFYKFFQMRGEIFFEPLSDDKISEIIKISKNFVDKYKKIVAPSKSKAVIKRKIRTNHAQNVKFFIKTIKKIHVPKKVSKNIMKYMPEKLLPLVAFTEELIKEQKKDKEYYDRSQPKSRITTDSNR